MNKQTYPLTYAVKHKNFDIRIESRSGGIFTALSDDFLNTGGIVYGVVLDEQFKARHYRATNADERNRMRGSKYVQSIMGNTYIDVKVDLDAGKRVLFSGTLCQIAGLKGFLEKDYDNLLCIDILCHGVPSPKIWKGYLNWQESKHGKCLAVDFRNKKDYGWAEHVETITMEKRGKIRKVDSRVFTTIFYSHLVLRECCHECPYKEIMHPGDITIADFWEIEQACPGFNDNKGVSLVFINNDKGYIAFDAITPNLDYSQTKLEESIRSSMFNQFPKPQQRNKFWRIFFANNFGVIARKFGGYTNANRLKQLIREIF